MGQRIYILLIIVAAVFSYTVYEAMKLDGKLKNMSISSEVTIKAVPEKSVFTNISDGSEYKLDEKLNSTRKIFIHFWATWCGPCEVEFPELVKMMNSSADKSDILFLLIAVNDEIKEIKKFMSRFKINNKNVFILEDKTNQFQSFGTYKLPESYLFSPSGKLIKKYPGKQVWSEIYNNGGL